MLLAVQAYRWWSVLRIDEQRYRPVAARHLAAVCAGISLIVVSAPVADDHLRLALWALIVAGAIGLGLAQSLVSLLTATRSLIDHEPQARVYRPLTLALLAAAGAVLRCPAHRPPGSSDFEASRRASALGRAAPGAGRGLRRPRRPRSRT